MLQTVMFSILAFASCFVNISLCLVLVRSQTMLKRTYNILVFNLAASDVLQGEAVNLYREFIFIRIKQPLRRQRRSIEYILSRGTIRGVL